MVSKQYILEVIKSNLQVAASYTNNNSDCRAEDEFECCHLYCIDIIVPLFKRRRLHTILRIRHIRRIGWSLRRARLAFS